MFINLAGWIMQLNFFLYVKRNWREDQINLSQFVDYYQKLNYDCRLVLFPEGTDLSEENRRRSDKYAQANNIQVFKIFYLSICAHHVYWGCRQIGTYIRIVVLQRSWSRSGMICSRSESETPSPYQGGRN